MRAWKFQVDSVSCGPSGVIGWVKSNFLFSLKPRNENATELKRTFKEVLVCSTTCLEDDQKDLKRICKKFSGTKRSLSFLRQNLTVRDFVKFLNGFDQLGKVFPKNSDQEDSFDESQILIHFDDDETSNSLKPSCDQSSCASSEISCNSSSLTSTNNSQSSFDNEDSESLSNYENEDCEVEIQELGRISRFSIRNDSFTLLKHFKKRSEEISVNENDFESSRLLDKDDDSASVKDPFENPKKRFNFTFTQKIVLVSMIVFVTLKLVSLTLSPWSLSVIKSNVSFCIETLWFCSMEFDSTSIAWKCNSSWWMNFFIFFSLSGCLVFAEE